MLPTRLALGSRLLGFVIDAYGVIVMLMFLCLLVVGDGEGGGCRGQVVLIVPPLTALLGSAAELLAWSFERLGGRRAPVHGSVWMALLGLVALGALGAGSFFVHLVPESALHLVIWGGVAVALLPFSASSLWRLLRALDAVLPESLRRAPAPPIVA